MQWETILQACGKVAELFTGIGRKLQQFWGMRGSIKGSKLSSELLAAKGMARTSRTCLTRPCTRAPVKMWSMKTVLQSDRTLTSTPCWCASCSTKKLCQTPAFQYLCPEDARTAQITQFQPFKRAVSVHAGRSCSACTMALQRRGFACWASFP